MGKTESTVVSVAADRIELSYGGASGVMTPDLTVLDNPRLSYDVGYRFLSFPLTVGKKWEFDTEWHNKASGNKGRTRMDVEVKGQERVKVPAGEFDALKLEAHGYMNFPGGNNRKLEVAYWYVPQLKAIARMEWVDRVDDFVSELVEFRPAP